MKERPILFSAPMVRAILAGTKTQTRRIVKCPTITSDWVVSPERDGKWWPTDGWDYVGGGITCPYGAPGDRLWVREAFTQITGNGIRTWYRADGEPLDSNGNPLPTRPGTRRWWPSIHMSRKQSRITLEVTGVRVETLHAITAREAVAEGVVDDAHGWDGNPTYPLARFRSLWIEINGSESWDANPWVWVVEFKRIEAQERAA